MTLLDQITKELEQDSLMPEGRPCQRILDRQRGEFYVFGGEPLTISDKKGEN